MTDSDHCSVIGLNSLKKRDGRWLKLLINKGKFTVNAIKTIKATVSPVLLSATDDDDDDDDSDVDGNGENDNDYGDEDD